MTHVKRAAALCALLLFSLTCSFISTIWVETSEGEVIARATAVAFLPGECKGRMRWK